LKVDFSPQEKREIIAAIQKYFSEERDEEIGNLAAEMLLDFFVEEVGPVIHNRAIASARKALKSQWEEMEFRLFELEKQLPRRK